MEVKKTHYLENAKNFLIWEKDTLELYISDPLAFEEYIYGNNLDNEDYELGGYTLDIYLENTYEHIAHQIEKNRGLDKWTSHFIMKLIDDHYKTLYYKTQPKNGEPISIEKDAEIFAESIGVAIKWIEENDNLMSKMYDDSIKGKYYISGGRYKLDDRKEDLYYYEIRDREGNKFSVEKGVLVNHIGTLISNKLIPKIEFEEIMFDDELKDLDFEQVSQESDLYDKKEDR